MTTLSLVLSQELQSMCKEKKITLPKSYFVHGDWSDGDFGIFITEREDDDGEITMLAPAYLLCELLAWLPAQMQDKYGNYILQVSKPDNGYDVGYNKDYADTPSFATYWDPNPCNAAGKLLIWLIKEGIING